VAAAPAPPPRPAPPPQAAPAADLEQLLGGRVLAWVGGAAVVAGLALLLALGVSRGWIGEGARTLMAAVLSLGLLAAGVWLHERRGHAQAARAAAASGICGLFMTATVATAVYGLAPTGAGLTLAFATGALATVLALRWSSPVVGGLGIAGAVLGPVLVGATGSDAALAFEAIAVVSAVGVLLSARWGWLMLAVFVLSVPQWVAWLLEAHSHTEAIVVLCLFGALYVAAALGYELRVPAERLRPASLLLLALNALTIGLAGWYELRSPAWLVLLAAAHLAAGIAARRSRRLTSDVGLVCMTLAVLLADAAYVLTVDGPGRTAGFAAVGVAFATLARRRRGGNEGLVSQYGLGGHIAVAAIQALSDATQAGAAPAATAGLVAVAASCLISARLAEEGNEAARVALDALGLAALAGIALLTLEGPALTVAWAGEAVALARIGARRDDLVARIAAFVHLAAAGVLALVDQVPPDGLISGSDDLAAAVIGAGAVGVATLLSALSLRDGDPARRTLALAVPVIALYLASIVVVTFGPDLQGQLQLSALWSVIGVAGLIVGLRRGLREIRLAAFSLLGLAAGKVFLYDLAALTSVYRVGSFLALGLLLLVAALAYQRMRPEITP
jgi:uncharacterized membrane protein